MTIHYILTILDTDYAGWNERLQEMKEAPKQEKHYEVAVWVNKTTEAMRKTECLCLHCVNMKPGEEGHCLKAQALFGVCIEGDIALTVTRCSTWGPKES